jgi:hypothetical protein
MKKARLGCQMGGTCHSKVEVKYLEVLLRIWEVPCSNLGLKPAILTEEFCCFPSSLQSIVAIMP